MKFIPSLTAAAVSVGLLVSASAQNDPIKFELPQVGTGANQTKSAPAPQAPVTQPAQAPAQQPAAPAVKFTEEQMMEVFGWVLADRNNLAALEFTPANIDAMARGMKMNVNGTQPSYDGQQIGPQLQELLAKRQQTLLTKIRNQNLQVAAEFFPKLEKENTNVKTLPSGLRYEVLTEGKGPIAKPGQVAKIHLVGALLSGQLIENTRMQRQDGVEAEPVEILVQEGTNIPGIVEALLKMPVGSKWRLFVPPHLAFGDDGTQGVPPAATLLFELEIFEVKDAPKDPNPPKK